MTFSKMLLAAAMCLALACLLNLVSDIVKAYGHNGTPWLTAATVMCVASVCFALGAGHYFKGK